MFNILSIVPGKKKQTASGWTSFNAICCHMRGHKVDKRGRGGIRFDGSNWIYHCFNCNYSCGFELGKRITSKTRELLKWCGVDEQEVQRWNLESLQHKNLLDFTQKVKKEKTLQFKSKKLPESELVENKPEHKTYIDYLEKRKVDYNKYKFYVTPNIEGRNSNRIIIPYYYSGNVVGHTSRFLDDRKPKYINDQQTGYVFGYDNQRKDWEVCILVEGIFDALCIDGCALMHDDISEVQAQVLAQLNRKIIFVPDRDKTGLKLCERALELGYSVSLPNWDESIKDVNDAVIKYGKLPTLLSILQNATSSKIKVEMQRNKIGKRI